MVGEPRPVEGKRRRPKAQLRVAPWARRQVLCQSPPCSGLSSKLLAHRLFGPSHLRQHLLDQSMQLLNLFANSDLLDERCLPQRPSAGEKAQSHDLFGRLWVLFVAADRQQPLFDLLPLAARLRERLVEKRQDPVARHALTHAPCALSSSNWFPARSRANWLAFIHSLWMPVETRDLRAAGRV